MGPSKYCYLQLLPFGNGNSKDKDRDLNTCEYRFRGLEKWAWAELSVSNGPAEVVVIQTVDVKGPIFTTKARSAQGKPQPYEAALKYQEPTLTVKQTRAVLPGYSFRVSWGGGSFVTWRISGHL